MFQDRKFYQFVKNQPVARFFYKGDHTHAVRRTVVIIDGGTGANNELLTGYELREGSVVRELKNVPIKSYRKDRIAKVKEIDKRRVLRRAADERRLSRSTMVRQSLRELLQFGI